MSTCTSIHTPTCPSVQLFYLSLCQESHQPTDRPFSNFYLALHSSLSGNSGGLTWVRLQQPQEQRYPFLAVCAVFLCVQTKVWLPMFAIFNVRTDVNAHDCTWGLYGHRKRVCTESWLWEKNPLPHRGIRSALAVCRFNALQTVLHPHPCVHYATKAVLKWWIWVFSGTHSSSVRKVFIHLLPNLHRVSQGKKKTTPVNLPHQEKFSWEPRLLPEPWVCRHWGNPRTWTATALQGWSMKLWHCPGRWCDELPSSVRDTPGTMQYASIENQLRQPPSQGKKNIAVMHPRP